MSHVCLLSHTEQPALFCGDTLFNAGIGNCHNGGHPEALHTTFSEQLARLPEDTQIYPGHDYIENNVRFTLNREPDNGRAPQMLERLQGQDPNQDLRLDLGRRARDQHLLPADEPDGDRDAARSLSRATRKRRSEDGS